MRTVSLVISGLTISLLAACASTPQSETHRTAQAPRHAAATISPTAPAPSITHYPLDATHLIADSSEHQKLGRVYQIAGRSYQPARNDRYDEVGIASWYGPNFHGRPTANGEIFDQNAMTAAHTTLPIPSIAEVTNLENGRTVLVRVNDRGPFVEDRIIDLSRAAATQLDYIGRGLARVRVRYIGPAHAGGPMPDPVYRSLSDPAGAPRESAPIHAAAVDIAADIPPAGQSVTLQIGAFSERANADRVAARLAADGDVWIEPASSDNGMIYRVFFGRWADRGAAFAAQSSLTGRGVFDTRIIALD